MRHHYQSHAVALLLICAVITTLYFLFAPKQAPVDKNILQGDRYIQIYSATWGQECNPIIKNAIENHKNKVVEKDADGKPIEQTQLTLVTTNNVLPAVSAACDGKMSCELEASSETLGLEPFDTCFKKLDVQYRCFTYDRLQHVSVEQSAPLTIDCDPHATTPKTEPAATK